MTAPIGVGYYQRKINVRNGLGLYLFHLQPQAAAQCRRDNPGAFIVGRFDSGNDATQARFDLPPEIAATDFFRTQIEPVVRANPGVYSAILGINEAWPNKAGLKWRADFELALCRLVQNWLHLPYIWGGISTGCLDDVDVPTFAPVWREAWAVNYHAYLDPDHTDIEDEVESWYVHRPCDVWLPELRTLGIKLRLFLGELGTFYPILKGDYMARCQIGIHREVAINCALQGVEYIGACAYGVGMMGDDQGRWELEASVERFAEVNAAIGATAPTGSVPPAPTNATNTTGGQAVISDFTSPNHGGPFVARGIVVHSTRGGTTSLEKEFDATVGWFNNPASQVSAHAVVSPTRTALPVSSALQAWHAGKELNGTHLGIEFCQAKPGDLIPDDELKRGAVVCAQWCVRYSIPLVWDLYRGFVQHKDTGQGQQQGKTDIGAGFNGWKFMTMVAQEVDKLKPVDATTDALNGIWAYSNEVLTACDRADLTTAHRAAMDLKERVVRLKAALGR